MLEAILHGTGEQTGCYTSPHLRRYNERIRVDDSPCSDREIVEAFVRVEAVRGEVPLTYFEFGTLAALQVFHQRGVTAAILEVGMGGRLDAVNAVEPDGGIITNVALDHCAWLGNDVESIAQEKAGIMREGKPLIFASEEVPASIIDRAIETGADLRILGRDYSYEADTGGTWNYRGRGIQLTDLHKPAMTAAVQVQNAAAALALLEATGKTDCLAASTINTALGGLQVPGRQQILQTDRRWLFDVAHNAAAARVLAGTLSELEISGQVAAIVSLLGDKDIAGFVSPLCAYVDIWVAVGVDATRAIPAADIARIVANTCGKACLVAESLTAAIDYAEARTTADDLILLTGSFYVVGPALDELYSRRTGE